MEKLSIIKVGGNVLDDENLFMSFLNDFAFLEGKKILVHGGGKIATEIGKKLQIESKYHEGRRITGDETIDLVTMVYGGLINKKIVSLLQSLDCDAMGITGADAMLVPAFKRPVTKIDYGWVGDLVKENIPVLKWKNFLEMEIIPVVAPLTCDRAGHLLNTNADTIAATLAMSLSSLYEVSLIYCFEKKGVLKDVGNDESYLSKMDNELYSRMKNEGRISAGILPKLQTAFEAKKAGVNCVMIGSSSQLSALIERSVGTQIL
jgi:acetylglutamate kinase